LLQWRSGDGQTLARIVPGNLLRIHDAGERVRGEAEGGVEVGAGPTAPVGVGLPPFARRGWFRQSPAPPVPVLHKSVFFKIYIIKSYDKKRKYK